MKSSQDTWQPAGCINRVESVREVNQKEHFGAFLSVLETIKFSYGIDGFFERAIISFKEKKKMRKISYSWKYVLLSVELGFCWLPVVPHPPQQKPRLLRRPLLPQHRLLNRRPLPRLLRPLRP